MFKLRKRLLWIFLALAGVALIFIVQFLNYSNYFNVKNDHNPDGVVAPTINDSTTLGDIPASVVSTRAIQSTFGRPVPTNKWWSSGILDDFPAPLYAWPLMSHITESNVKITAPSSITSERAVMSVPKDQLLLTVPNDSFTKAHAKEWGDWHVVFEILGQQGDVLFDMTTAEGSPFIYFKPYISEFSLQIPPNSTAEAYDCQKVCDEAILIKAPGTTYLLATNGNKGITLNGDRIDLVFADDSIFSIAVIASNGKVDDYLSFALQPIEVTAASFSVTDNTVITTFQTGKPTMYGIFPHQAPYVTDLPEQPLGTYETLRGKVNVYAGSSFKTVLSRPAILPSLPITDTLKNDQTFINKVKADLASQTEPTGDVYASAKLLLKNAQLSEIAYLTDQENTKILSKSLQNWCTASRNETSNFFAYDSQMGGLLAIEPAFGSQRYNDHHFHAGYFIHSAAILAQQDPDFIQKYGDCIDLIIKDIATLDTDDESFPRLRNFDPYAGHSWANGIEYLLDGNNQESTSEAIHTWFSIILWGKTIQDNELIDLGTWLMTQEIAATKAYWFNTENTLPETFDPPMISILWGGKVDYNTFFDRSIAAIHGIQFFPITTALIPTIDQNILERLVNPVLEYSYDNIWDTNLVLVDAFNNQDQKIPSNAVIDASLSQSYITHWMTTLKELGRLEPVTSACAVVFSKGESRSAVIYRYPQDKDTCSLVLRDGTEINLDNIKEGWNIISL